MGTTSFDRAESDVGPYSAPDGSCQSSVMLKSRLLLLTAAKRARYAASVSSSSFFGTVGTRHVVSTVVDCPPARTNCGELVIVPSGLVTFRLLSTAVQPPVFCTVNLSVAVWPGRRV